MNYERITAADVRVGDLIAHAKSHFFYEVRSVDPPGATSVYINLIGGHRLRPRLTTKLWRRHD